MTGGKRSAPVTFLALGVAALLSSCTEPATSSSVLEAAQPVAVLTSPDEWKAGVLEHELELGETLLFDFGRPLESPRFHMSGVDYELELVALAGNGHHLDSLLMVPCLEELDACPTYALPLEARYWLERRVQTS